MHIKDKTQKIIYSKRKYKIYCKMWQNPSSVLVKAYYCADFLFKLLQFLPAHQLLFNIVTMMIFKNKWGCKYTVMARQNIVFPPSKHYSCTSSIILYATDNRFFSLKIENEYNTNKRDLSPRIISHMNCMLSINKLQAQWNVALYLMKTN